MSDADHDLEAARRRIAELEQLLRETDERADAFRRIVQSIDHHLYINEILPDGGRRAIFVGPGRDRLLGGVPEDGDWGRAWIEAVHPDDRALYAEHTARYLRGEMSEVLCRLVGLDGVTRWIRGGGSPRRDGDRLIVEGIVRDATAEVHAEKLLQEASRTDALTSIFNRRHFAEMLDAELERSRAERLTPGLLLVDVDHFKLVNDTFGHLTGDAVLVEVAARLRRALRRFDTVARWGGEEFIVLAPALEDARAAARDRATGCGASVVAAPVRHGDRAHRRHGLDRRRARRSDELGRPARRSGRPLAVLGQAPRARSRAPVRRAHARRPRVRGARVDPARAGALAGRERARGHARAALGAGRRELSGTLAAGARAAAGHRAALPPRRLAARHRQGRDPRPHPGEARARSTTRSGRSCAPTPRSASRSSAASARSARPRARCATTTSASTAAGYPDGLAGDAIPIEARVVAVSDAYSAITSDRVYARGRAMAEALSELRRIGGRAPRRRGGRRARARPRAATARGVAASRLRGRLSPGGRSAAATSVTSRVMADTIDAIVDHRDRSAARAERARCASSRWTASETRRRRDRLATEEPLEIRASGPGQPTVRVAVTMRTPGPRLRAGRGLPLHRGPDRGAPRVLGDPLLHGRRHRAAPERRHRRHARALRRDAHAAELLRELELRRLRQGVDRPARGRLRARRRRPGRDARDRSPRCPTACAPSSACSSRRAVCTRPGSSAPTASWWSRARTSGATTRWTS